MTVAWSRSFVVFHFTGESLRAETRCILFAVCLFCDFLLCVCVWDYTYIATIQQRKQLSSAPSTISDLEDIELARVSLQQQQQSLHTSSTKESSSRAKSPPSRSVSESRKKSARKTTSTFRSLFGSMSLSSASSSSSSKRTVLPVARSESMAYPISSTSSMLSRLQYQCRRNSQAVLATLAVATLFLWVAADLMDLPSPSPTRYFRGSTHNNYGLIHWGGAVREGYFHAQDAVKSPTEFQFAAVTDLDELSKQDPESKKPSFYSIFLSGTLTKTSNNRYDLVLDDAHTRTLVTKHNEAGRGAEFSELVLFQNRLVTFDDRTGDVFEILNSANGKESFVVPRFVITEGDGETDKGMKWEWATVKGKELYMGSMGKEYTLQDGTVKNRNNLWIAVLNEDGQIRREDWTQQYTFVRKALGAQFPGYMIIEACNWSPILKKWVFVPRRISKEAYDENKDETMGGRQLVLVDEYFTSATVVDIKLPSTDPLKGFSTFAFVPNSNDRHVLAIRTVEENCVNFTPQCQQRSYFIVFDIMTGEVLSDEIEYKDKVKFEGVEFVDMFTVPPPTE